MKPGEDTLREAMRLMQNGDLRAATRALQHALDGRSAAAPSSASREGSRDTMASGSIIEGEFRVIDDDPSPSARDTVRVSAVRGNDANRDECKTDASRPYGAAFRSSGAAFERLRSRSRSARPPTHGNARERDGVDFPLHPFSCAAGELPYGLHVPAGLDTSGAPLLVMLHGCTQTPADFARGTRMNQLAAAQGYVVAWPAQTAERNQNRCWNWFRAGDQQRGQGEPAMIAALARHLVAKYRLDPARVYVAGLSAGGAMAAVLAGTHPDVFAAIGVHSGLPTGLAQDVPSAFAAMRKGGVRRVPSTNGGMSAVPAIVFHGDSDTTVHPSNGRGVVEQTLGRGIGEGKATADVAAERITVPGGHAATRTVHRAADGRVMAEHWLVHGAAHTWSGGDACGTYTDPRGPDASALMLRFFQGCRRHAEATGAR